MNELEKAGIIMSLQNKIHFEENMPLLYAGVLANTVLNHFDERVLEGVQQWLEGSLTPEFTVDGICLKNLQKVTGASLFGALCMLDVQLQNPDSMPCITWTEWRDEIK